ncbi:LysR family transcriptional regulator [Thaumasiovibrio subtropicus]|uniref:LysR family transcriptional regulator n=1 Tax=Thaumasiovibrio subtropicus TaxID=1891207 RepID=UPI000B35EB7D|nr:LysR family transcriptional regulator [Thaumasiovibrio subtropicus]
MPKSDDLILFSRVVELGAFSKAADEANVTHSVVSKRIGRLEDELGVQLLYRTTRRLTLTEAGQALYEKAKLVRQMTSEAFDLVSGYGERLSGRIRLSVPTISGELLLAEAVAEFCAEHPGLSVEMSMDNRFVDVIEEGFDLVIRTGYLEDSSLIARHILDSYWVVCAAPHYIRTHGAPTEPEQLKDHNCLLYDYHTSGATEWAFNDEEGERVVRVSGSLSTDNTAALRQSALAGFGIIYVPRCLVYPDIESGALVELFEGKVAKCLGVYALYPYTRQPPLKIRLLIEHIRKRYLDLAPYFAERQGIYSSH